MVALLSKGKFAFTTISTENSSFGKRTGERLKVIEPVLPTLGEVIVPDFEMNLAETKAVFIGVISVMITLVAFALPVLPTVMV